MEKEANSGNKERAAIKFSAAEQHKLPQFPLHVVPISDADLPAPRQFSDEEIQNWLAEDEAGMRQFRDEK